MSAAENQNDKDDPNPENWVEDYSNYLYKIAYVRLGNASTAEDVVQETFLAGIKSLERFDGNRPIKYWLRGILRHKIVDYIRKASREVQLDDQEDEGILDSISYKTFGVPWMRPEKWKIDPESAFERKEFMEQFHHCLAKMKGPMRDAFVMRELEGVDADEICKVLDVSSNNYWVLMHRARNALKACLEASWGNAKNKSF